MKIKKGMALVMAMVLLLAGCQSKGNTEQNSGFGTGNNVSTEDGIPGGQTANDLNGTTNSGTNGTAVITSSEVESVTKELSSSAALDSEDKTVRTAADADAVVISFDKTSIKVDGTGCTIDGTTVTIEEAGTYVLQGTLQDGCVIVDAGKKSVVHLVLNGVTITNNDSAAIFVKKSLKTVISLENGTVNTLTDGTQYVYENEEDDEPKAALYSKSDLTINGTGTLVVNGNYNDGITCKDSLKLLGGIYQITSADDGIVGKDMIVIENGSYTINAEGDGMKSSNDSDETLGFILISDGTFEIISENDAIQAETRLVISGGNFHITTGGGSANAPAHTNDDWFGFGGWRSGSSTTTESSSSSSKGLKAGTALQIDGGIFVLDTNDDALHSNGTVLLNAGEFTIATGDDGIHADTVLVINDGKVTVTKSYEGLEAVYIVVNGGEISITASDDGINAAGDAVLALEEITEITDSGNSAPEDPFGASGQMPDGGMAQGGMPDQMPDGNMAQGDMSGRGTAPGGTGQMPGGNNGMGGNGMTGGRQFGMGGMTGMGENTSATLVINGGTIYVNAQGDGLDSNGTIEINGGTVFVDGPTDNNNAALDYDVSAVVNGGTLAFAGSVGMAMAPSSDSEQASIALTFSKTQAAGTSVVLYDENGTEIFRYTPAKSFQHLVLSSSEIKSGASYSITYGSSGSTGQFTLSDSAVTYVSSDGSVTTGNSSGGKGGFGGFGGFGGGRQR